MITGSRQNGHLGYRVCRAQVITTVTFSQVATSNPANQVMEARASSSTASFPTCLGTVRWVRYLSVRPPPARWRRFSPGYCRGYRSPIFLFAQVMHAVQSLVMRDYLD